MLRRFWLWACWLLLVFGAMNIYGSSDNASSPAAAYEYGAQNIEPRWAPDIFLRLQRTGTDVNRYFAYASASLGRPYHGDYIRPPGGKGEMVAGGADDVVTPDRPLRPWRDFTVEYPPGMLAPALVPALFTSNFETYFFLFGLEMQTMLTIAAMLAVKTADALTLGSGRQALLNAILLTAALGSIAVRRYDACVALAIAATFFGLATRRPILTGLSFGLGVALKGVPLLLAPILIVWFALRRDWVGLFRSGASAALCLGLTGLLYLMAAGPHWSDVFAYHADRPLQVETSYSGVLMLLKPLFPDIMTVKFSYGSHNVVSVVEPAFRRVAGLLEAAAILATYAIAYSRIKAAPDDRQKTIAAISAAGACLAAFVIFGKVFSAQYLTWLLPLGAVASAASGRGTPWRLVIANAFTQVEYPYLYLAAIGYGKAESVFGLVIVARTFALWRWGAKALTDNVLSLPVLASGADEKESDRESPKLSADSPSL
jgi:hypothetical protein